MSEVRSTADVRSRLRARLAPLGLPPAREHDIVEELVQLFDDAAADPARRDIVREGSGVPGANVREADLPDVDDPAWRALLAEIERREVTRARPVPVKRPTEGRRTMKPIGLRHDLVCAWRGLRRHPGLTAVAVATLALGIGLNAAVFSLVDHVLLRPLAVENGEQLVRVYGSEPGDVVSKGPVAYPDVVDLSTRAQSLVGTAAYAMTFVALEGEGGKVDLTIGEMVTGSYFSILGVEPSLGRLLMPEDDRRGGSAPVVVLAHRAWQRRFGGDPTLVGRKVVVNGRSLVVAGVVPPDFRGLTRGIEPELWMTIETGISLGAGATVNVRSDGPAVDDVRDDRAHRWLWMIARRTPEVSTPRATAEIAAVGAQLADDHPASNEHRALVGLPLGGVRILPGQIDGGLTTGSGVLMVLVALVLMIACANLANLFLARAIGRRREIATRLSLGASRGRVMRQLLVESGVLALLGSVASLLVVAVSNRLLWRFDIPNAVPISIEPSLDHRVVGFTLAIGLVTAFLFGMTPALEAWRSGFGTALRDGGRTVSHRRRRLQGVLVVAQVTLSMLLLVFAGLSLRSIRNATRMDPGFDVHGAVAATLMPNLQGYEEGRIASFYRDVRTELEGMSGVASVSLPSHVPLTFWIDTWSLAPVTSELPREDWPEIDSASVDADYFSTMAIPLLAGRPIARTDTRDGRRVVVVNQTLAERFWPEQDPIGKRLYVASRDSEPYEVAGVARDGRYRTLGETSMPFVYLPISEDASVRTLVVRFADPRAVSPARVARAIHAVDPHLAISNLGTLAEITGASLLLPRLSAFLFGLFGLLGLALAALGLYGILSFMVSQRRHEIGIRMALGAHRDAILGLVLRDGLRLTVLGLVAGIVLALASARVLSAILYGVSPYDAFTLLGVAALLIAVATAASLVPARRATRVEPVVALRSE